MHYSQTNNDRRRIKVNKIVLLTLQLHSSNNNTNGDINSIYTNY